MAASIFHGGRLVVKRLERHEIHTLTTARAKPTTLSAYSVWSLTLFPTITQHTVAVYPPLIRKTQFLLVLHSYLRSTGVEDLVKNHFLI